MARQGQAALEFLTTYGWAILGVLGMIGALAYFGVLDLGDSAPQRCEFGTRLYCEDFQINDTMTPGMDAIKFQLRNILTTPISFGTMEFKRKGNATYTPCLPGSTVPSALNGEEAGLFICLTDREWAVTAGEDERLELRVLYTNSLSYNVQYANIAEGDIYARAR